MLNPSKLLTDLVILNTLVALEKGGVLKAMDGYRKKTEGVDLDRLAQELVLDSVVLKTLCDFLVINLPEFITKKCRKYYLGKDYSSEYLKNILYFSMAYESVFINLFDLLSKKKVYGRNLKRNGEYLCKSSAIYNKNSWDALLKIFFEIDCEKIVDLGCGSGDFLVKACSVFPNMEGVGIEIEKKTIELANKNLSDTHNIKTKKISIINGNIADPEIWRKHLVGDRVAFVGITVWHELLRSGEQYLVDVFSKYRRYFPGSAFIVVEYNGSSLEGFNRLSQQLRMDSSVYHFVHHLTLQGVPQTTQKWRELLENSGVYVKEVIPVLPYSSIYIGQL